MTEDLAMRALAFTALDEERQYQDAKSQDMERPDMRPNLTIGEHMLAIDKLLTDMKAQWYSGSEPHTTVMDNMRKLTALGLQCMEQHGVVRRNQ